MSTLTQNRAAERFARLIDLDATPPLLGSGNPAMHSSVALARALRAAARTTSPAPLSAEARLAMRQRLVAAASAPGEASLLSPGVASRAGVAASRATDAVARAKDSSRRVGRKVSALVGSVVIVTSISGVGVAAARSLPGSPFYDLKRATESVQLWLASGPAAKGERHLEFARTRLAEAQKLGADSKYAASTLTAMNKETREGSSDLISAYKSNGDKEPLADLVTFTRAQYAGLVQFGNEAGTKLEAQTVYSMTLLAGVAQEVESVSGTTCLTCLVTGVAPHGTPTPGTSTPPSPATSPSVSGSSPAVTGSPTHPLPTNLLPTGIVPTQIPTKLPTLPPLITRHNGKAGKHPSVLPTLSPLPLISALKNLL